MVANILAYRCEILHGAQCNYRIKYTLVHTISLKIDNLTI